MDSVGMVENQKPHAMLVPHPSQGHITPMLKLAKLLHHKGFHITFVNTQHNHSRLLKSQGANSLHRLPDFHFRAIPDGMPSSDSDDAAQDVPSLCYSISHNCLAPLCDLILDINSNSSHDLPKVSCIIGDGIMTFTIVAARRFQIPIASFWTASACSFLGYMQYDKLVQLGLVPFKGMKIVYIYTYMLHEHDSPQWYDIVHFQHKALMVLVCNHSEGLAPMERVFFYYKPMIIS